MAVTNQFWPVAHRCELERPGDFVVLPAPHGEQIAITNIDGELVAWDGRCVHRGAQIYGPGFSAGNREPRCGYHGRQVSARTVRRRALAEYGGWLFVGDGSSGSETIVGLLEPTDLGEFVAETPRLSRHGAALAYPYPCHWSVAVENALDLEHVPHVHAGSLAKMGLVSEALQLQDNGSSFEIMRSESMNLDRLSRVFPFGNRFDYCHAHFQPYACLSSTRGWTYSLQHYIPRPDGRTDFVHRLYVTPTTRPIPAFFDSVAALNEQVFREDAEICARVPAGYEGQLGPRDRRIAHFRESL